MKVFFTKETWSKLPVSLILAWCSFLLIIYFFLIQQTKVPVIVSSRPSAHTLDAVVYIAMGKLAADPIIDYSIASVRKLGQWHGKVYVVTDNPTCFDSTVKNYDVKVVKVPSVKSIIEIKAMKTKLFDSLPTNVNSILYLDVDIVVRQSFESFYKDLSDILSSRIPSTQKSLSSSSSGSDGSESISNEKKNENENEKLIIPSGHFDYAAFPDAKGHYVGFCSGCEKWHTGVIYMKRNEGKSCLAGWEKILLSGKFNTDQESLDEAEKTGYCPNAVTLPSKHLLFAKDYIGMALSSGQTFIHFTSAARIEETDTFYRNIIVPNLRRALDPPLSASIFDSKKICLTIDAGHNNTVHTK